MFSKICMGAFGGLDYVTYPCCAKCNNLYLYGFGTNFQVYSLFSRPG